MSNFQPSSNFQTHEYKVIERDLKPRSLFDDRRTMSFEDTLNNYAKAGWRVIATMRLESGNVEYTLERAVPQPVKTPEPAKASYGPPYPNPGSIAEIFETFFPGVQPMRPQITVEKRGDDTYILQGQEPLFIIDWSGTIRKSTVIQDKALLERIVKTVEATGPMLASKAMNSLARQYIS